MNDSAVVSTLELDQAQKSEATAGPTIDRIFAGDLPKKALQDLVDTWCTKAQFAILERIDNLQFPLPTAEPVVVSDWTKGRIFGKAFELRWEKIDGDFRVIFSFEQISETALSGLGEIKDRLSGCSVSEPTYYLWDESNTRLGHKLEYKCVKKIKDDQNILLRVREYRDARGRLVFWRYLNMEPE
jgi:hypothetical protein